MYASVFMVAADAAFAITLGWFANFSLKTVDLLFDAPDSVWTEIGKGLQELSASQASTAGCSVESISSTNLYLFRLSIA
jgi:hypothetical protein